MQIKRTCFCVKNCEMVEGCVANYPVSCGSTSIIHFTPAGSFLWSSSWQIPVSKLFSFFRLRALRMSCARCLSARRAIMAGRGPQVSMPVELVRGFIVSSTCRLFSMVSASALKMAMARNGGNCPSSRSLRSWSAISRYWPSQSVFSNGWSLWQVCTRTLPGFVPRPARPLTCRRV